MRRMEFAEVMHSLRCSGSLTEAPCDAFELKSIGRCNSIVNVWNRQLQHCQRLAEEGQNLLYFRVTM